MKKKKELSVHDILKSKGKNISKLKKESKMPKFKVIKRYLKINKDME